MKQNGVRWIWLGCTLWVILLTVALPTAAEETGKKVMTEEEEFVSRQMQMMHREVLTGEESKRLFDILQSRSKTLQPHRLEEIITNLNEMGPEVLGHPRDLRLELDRNKHTVWQKGEYSRTEWKDADGSTHILICRPDGIFEYQSIADTYLRSDQCGPDKMPEDPVEVITFLGPDIFYGRQAAVFEVRSVKYPNITGKVWLEPDWGLAIRSESTLVDAQHGVSNTTVSEVINVIFDEVSDSFFDVPKDKIVEADRPKDRPMTP